MVDDRAVARARSVQMVFQDAAGSLNPRMTVRQAMNEVCAIRRRMGAECRRSPEELMDLVELSKSVLDQYPREMSGGVVSAGKHSQSLGLRTGSVDSGRTGQRA